MYLSYLTIVPAMCLFLIRVETSFHNSYRAFYGAIVGKQSLNTIRSVKESMVDHIRLSIERLLKIQGVITCSAILATPYLIQVFRMMWFHLNVMRIGILGAFLHVLMLFLIIFLLYFEFRASALAVTLLFFILNGLLTALSLKLGMAFYGYGYFSACLITLMAGLFIMDYKIRNLEYITFIHQPVK